MELASLDDFLLSIAQNKFFVLVIRHEKHIYKCTSAVKRNVLRPQKIVLNAPVQINVPFFFVSHILPFPAALLILDTEFGGSSCRKSPICRKPHSSDTWP
jgi:hypothetical protein